MERDLLACANHCFLFFFFNDTATTEIYTLSLHDALPISPDGPLAVGPASMPWLEAGHRRDRKSTRLNSSHSQISYAVFCLKKKKTCEARRIFYSVICRVQYVRSIHSPVSLSASAHYRHVL